MVPKLFVGGTLQGYFKWTRDPAKLPRKHKRLVCTVLHDSQTSDRHSHSQENEMQIIESYGCAETTLKIAAQNCLVMVSTAYAESTSDTLFHLSVFSVNRTV